MKRCFVFCHGFGFDAHAWDKLRPYFASEHCVYLDLGYFGNEQMYVPEDKSTQFIAVGHSLGLIKLKSLNINFTSFIGIQGFVNFLGDDPAIRESRACDWAALKELFNSDPIKTLQNFYKRCGRSVPYGKLENINKNKLIHDLEYLSASIKLLNNVPTLIIASQDDVIVPPALIYDNFSEHSNVTIIMHENGQHCLDDANSEIVYQNIMDFVNAPR